MRTSAGEEAEANSSFPTLDHCHHSSHQFTQSKPLFLSPEGFSQLSPGGDVGFSLCSPSGKVLGERSTLSC